MDTQLFFASLAATGLLLYSLIKWGFKGKLFHPALTYCVLNCGFFLIFAFGPYVYTYEIYPFYYFMYVLLMYVFVGGIIWGCAAGRKKGSKELRLTSKQLMTLFVLSIFLSIFVAVSLITTSGGNLEQAVNNRFESLEFAGDKSNSNPLVFFLSTLDMSFRQFSTALLSSYIVWQGRHYERLVILFLLNALIAAFSNSRTLLFFGMLSMFVPTYIILTEKKVIDFTKLNWSKNLKYTVPLIVVTLAFIVLLTNVRSTARSDGEIRYETVEKILQVERKEWFDRLTEVLPESILTPISEFSIYAGGTIACGGAVTNIAVNSSLNTLGMRTIFPIHRILDRLGFGDIFVRLAEDNLAKILERGSFVLGFWWWGDPANFIVDYGLFLAPLASMLIGWAIGWIYGRLEHSGSVVKATGSAIILNAMLLTPATSPFSYLPNCVNLLMIVWYLHTNTLKIYQLRQYKRS